MPYTAENVPANVPKDKAEQWAKIWNSAYNAAQRDGLSDKDAESKAFREANGVIKRESPL